MSVIWGLWRRHGNPCARQDLAHMADRLTEYAADGIASWAEAGVGLGRGLAATLPEDAFDNQPLELHGGSVLVADLRLDNRTDLAAQLGIEAARERGLADAQILAAAWERWQQACLSRLVGSFAFAVWDVSARRLFCARDPMGRRSLYYSTQAGLFAFATLPRALHALPEIPPAADEGMIAIRLAFLPHAGQRTYFQNIRRLPPAHCLTVDEHGETVRRYWALDPERRIALGRDEDYAEALREVFDEAVRCRLRARAPIGSMLSGGFDSGSVTASAARLLAQQGRELTAFTAVPAPEFHDPVESERFSNEAEHAASVAALHSNIRHVLVPPVPVCPLNLLARQRSPGDSPGSHFSMAPYACAMAEAHRRAGVGVVLTGLNGNMTISYRGLPLLAQLMRRGRWGRWYRAAQGLRGEAHFGWGGVLAQSFGPFLPGWLWRTLQPSSLYRDVRQYVLLHPRYFEQGELFRLAEELGWDLAYPPDADGQKRRLANLGRFDRGAGAAGGMARCGIDFRDPTIDRRVVEFCLAVPDEQYLRGGQTRSLLRRAMAGRLSPLVLGEWRKGIAGADWYLRVAPYRARFAAAVEDIAQSPVARHCLDIERMRRLVAAWPQTWTTLAVRREYGMGLDRAIQAGAFLRWVEGGA